MGTFDFAKGGSILALLFVGCSEPAADLGDAFGTESSNDDETTSDSGSVDESSGDGEDESGDDGPKLDVAGTQDIPEPPDWPDESTCEKAAESLTSAGCSFAPIMGNPKNAPCGIGCEPQPWAVVAANAGTEVATATLYDTDGNEYANAMIEPGDSHVFEIPPEEAELMEHPSASALFHSLRLESDIPITAYQFAPYSESSVAESDAAMLLPTHAWGSNYMVFNAMNEGPHWLNVASLEDGVEVTVVMGSSIINMTTPGDGVPALAAGEEFVTVLDAQETLHILAEGSDTTGTQVYSKGWNGGRDRR